METLMTNGRLSANTISISSYWQYFDLSFITEKNTKHLTEKPVYFRNAVHSISYLQQHFQRATSKSYPLAKLCQMCNFSFQVPR